METRDNKYLKWYWNICENAKTKEIQEGVYTEKHHIYPKSIYGENKDLVRLTAREHYIVHLCLWQGLRQKYGTKDIRTRKMARAFTCMNKTSSKHTGLRYNGKEFSFLRVAWHECNIGENNPNFGGGYKLSEETKQKMRKPKSKEHILHMVQNRKIVKGPEHPMYGRIWTEEEKMKLRKPKSLECKEKMKLYRNLPETRKRLSEQTAGIKNPKANKYVIKDPSGNIFEILLKKNLEIFTREYMNCGVCKFLNHKKINGYELLYSMKIIDEHKSPSSEGVKQNG